MIISELTDVFDRYRSDKDIFHDLMPHKMQEILLVATLYDAFILERDGLLSEQIFGEYYQLNLTSAPRITSAYSREDALRKLAKHNFDSVILMVGIDVRTPLEIAADIRAAVPEIPILLLFNNSVALPLCPPHDAPEMAPIDRVFVWNGYSKIFLAMTKYVEDQLNVDNDLALGMVQVILLIEDGVRFYSRYLPVLYVEIMRQTQRLIGEENLDEMHKLLRMRARPKVLLATSHEEALALFTKYRDNLLAVITDVQFPCQGSSDPEAGLRFVGMLKQENPDLPVLVQSSDLKNEARAHALGASFVHKSSEHLAGSLRAFLTEHLGFGCFVFRDPEGNEIGRVHNLDELEGRLQEIPDETLLYHAQRNHFSAWLMAHGEVLFARILRSARIEDFQNAEEMRAYIRSIFVRVRNLKVQGRVVHFNEYVFSQTSCIARLADGSLGGKGRGTAFISHLVENIDLSSHVEGIDIRQPRTAIIGIDAFETFIETFNTSNGLYGDEDYERIRRRFLETPLPDFLTWKLRKFLQLVTRPLAVRSSGLFEDMLLQPFAGIYDTFLIPNSHPDPEVRYQQLVDAIRLVYASIFSPKSRAYFDIIHYKLEEERMAVVLQEVVGQVHDGRYCYPHISGTAQSHNFYPIHGIAPEDGIANLALGLGTYVVDGEQCFRFCPRHPRVDLVAPEAQSRASQRHFYALDLQDAAPDLIQGEQACYTRLDVSDAEKHTDLSLLASVYDIENQRLNPGLSGRGPRILNFANILKYDALPLAKTISLLLEIGEKALGNPVELEYAVDLGTKPGDRPAFYLLQLKPLIHRMEEITLSVDQFVRDEAVLFTDRAMGNGSDATIHDIVFADPELFDNTHTLEMVDEVEQLNRDLREAGRHAVFISFGRWGTRDHWLGVPVQFHQITQARVLVEASLPHFQIDSSLGSHFFHNVTSMGIGYFTLQMREANHFVNWEWLRSLTPVRTTAHFRHVHTEAPLEIFMDGRQGLALIRKPLI